MNELQPSIEEKETTGQLFAVSPLAAVTTPSGEGEDEASTSPRHDTPPAAADDDKEDVTTGQLIVTV